MLSSISKYIWLVLGLVLCIGYITGLPTSKDNSLSQFNKRREEIKQRIMETLGHQLSFSSSSNKDEAARQIKKMKERVNTDIVRNVLKTLKSEDLKEIVFVQKDDQILERCKSGQYIKELTLQFHFDLDVFQQNSLTNAFIYFYKRDDTPAEEILVKEVPDVGTHEHTINRAYFNKNGWVQMDITKQVGYWSEDYEDEESRTLKLMCAGDCTELYIEHCDAKSLPFLTLELTAKNQGR